MQSMMTKDGKYPAAFAAARPAAAIDDNIRQARLRRLAREGREQSQKKLVTVIVVIMLLVLGSVTPPVGILAMVACKIAGITYGQSLGMLLPFTLVWLAVILLVAYVPELVLWLPRMMQ